MLSLPIIFVCGEGGNTASQNDPGVPLADTINVMTYNIHHCNPPSEPDRMDVGAIARIIREQDPDLVALQEVDVKTSRSGKELDQAKRLAELTNMHYYFKKSTGRLHPSWC